MSLTVIDDSTSPEERSLRDGQIRELLRDSAMPGWVELAMVREPSYLESLRVHGHTNQTIVDVRDDRVVAVGCRSIRAVYVNERQEEIGYLSGLRVAPEARAGRSLLDGYRRLRSLHEGDGRVKAYLTTIIEDNEKAIRLLTSGRGSLPRYEDRGRYFSCAINLNRRRRRRSVRRGLEIVPGDAIPRVELLAFLGTGSQRRQFFPNIGANGLDEATGHGLRQADFRVAIRQGRIVGTVAAWDQSRFKQELVCGYRPGVHRLRPLINTGLRLAGYRQLPAPGERLRTLYAAAVCIEDDRPEVFLALMETLYQTYKSGEFHFLAIGFAENDPLYTALGHFFHFKYVSRMYLVYWEDGEEFCRSLKAEPPMYFELATL